MPAQHRRRTRRTRTRRRKNRNLFTRKRNNIAYSLKRGGGGDEAAPIPTADPFPNEPYPTFNAVEPPFISRTEDQTEQHRAALQQYEAAKNKYFQELANWREKRVKYLKRPLTFDEMHGTFGTVSVFPVPSWPARPTAAAADARNYQHTPGPL
jgi:hypothetical protein